MTDLPCVNCGKYHSEREGCVVNEAKWLAKELDRERERSARYRAALEEMHQAVMGREYEPHSTLTSLPAQNGCYVYTEWKLKAIKEKALTETKKEGGE